VLYAFKHHTPATYVEEKVPEEIRYDESEFDADERQKGTIFSRMKEWFEQL